MQSIKCPTESSTDINFISSSFKNKSVLHLDVECLFMVDFFLSWSKLLNNFDLFTKKLVFYGNMAQMKKHIDLYHNF